MKFDECTSICFWEPVPSPHKLHLLREIATATPERKILCMADADLSSDRRELGWKYIDPGTDNLVIEVKPPRARIEELAEKADCLHIFSGIRWVKIIRIALDAVLISRAKFMIMSEPRATDGFKGKLRYIHSLLTERRIRDACLGVFAIGAHGRPWFLSIGYRANAVYDFAYFVDAPIAQVRTNLDEGIAPRPDSRRIYVGYLGRLVRSKGLLLLPSALKSSSNNCTLVMGGVGPLVEKVTSMCAEMGVPFEYKGRIEMDRVGDFLAAIDVLVLPSLTTEDGWGVVVSEALMIGTPVVVSGFAGASIVMMNDLFGRKTLRPSSKHISEAIDIIVETGELAPERRAARRNLAIDFLSARAGAGYFLRAVEHALQQSASLPQPKWLNPLPLSGKSL